MGQSNNQKIRQRASEKRMTPLETCLVEAIVQAEAPRIRNQLPRSERALEALLDAIQLHQ